MNSSPLLNSTPFLLNSSSTSSLLSSPMMMPTSPVILPSNSPNNNSPVGETLKKSKEVKGVNSPKVEAVDPPSILSLSLKSEPSKRGGQSYWMSGRPPWYNQAGSLKETFIIGIAGGTSSGKTTVCHRIVEELNIPWAVLLSQDSFYKNLEGEDLEKAKRSEYNFDHPDAFDYDLLVDVLKRLKRGQRVQIPVYNFKTHSRERTTRVVYGADVILFEGILAFYNEEILKLMDLKIFVDADSDTRLARRCTFIDYTLFNNVHPFLYLNNIVRRDIKERGRDINYVLKQYQLFVKPSYEEYIAPTKVNADIIIPNGSNSTVAIDVIVQHIKLKLQKRQELRGKLNNANNNIVNLKEQLPENLFVVPPSSHIIAMHTLLRDETTSRDDFIFITERITRLLIEFAISTLDYTPVEVKTPTGWNYQGLLFNDAEICGVSIMRAGESMEIALREVVKDVKIGKLLIQTNQTNFEPELIYCKLPSEISEKIVFLMDPMIGTGATALMAIRVLLDHNVKEENIYFLSLIATMNGIFNIAYAYPNVKIITTECETDRVNEQFFILPGVGNFGDRYYGTDHADSDDEDDLDEDGQFLLPPPIQST